MSGAQDKDRILELLGSGLSNTIVATTVGCDPSYITQLMSTEEFSSAVIERRSATLLSASKRDRKADNVEDTLLDLLKEHVETRQIYKPADVLRAYATINRATRRGNPADQSVTINNNIVQLTIPTVVIKNFTKNTHGEVIEVEGQDMQTMPAQSLLKHLARTKGVEGGQVYERVGRFIAPAVEHASHED